MISWVNFLIVLLLHNLSRKKQKEKKYRSQTVENKNFKLHIDYLKNFSP
jgi:hypothetical protein